MRHPDGPVARRQQCVLVGGAQLHRRAGARGRARPIAVPARPAWTQDTVAPSDGRGAPHHVGVCARCCKEAAKRAGWGTPLPRGRGRGIAFQFSHRGYVAQVAEVTVSREGELKVDRVTVVTDIGGQDRQPQRRREPGPGLGDRRARHADARNSTSRAAASCRATLATTR